MNWQETMERFWRPVDEFHRHKYGHSTASDNNSIVKPSKRYIAFLADYFTDRSLTLNGFPSTPDAIINQAFVLQSIHQQLSDKCYQASDGCSVIKSAANSPPSTGRKPSPSLSQVEPNSSSASVIQSTQQLNSVELIEQQKRSDWPTVTSKTGQQLRLSIDNIPAIEKFSQSAQDLQPTADWLQFNLIGGGPLTIPETASVESMDVCIDPQNGQYVSS
jgi:hypothetical protein